MSIQNDPLQKQLLHIRLGKGVNERDRPETADPETTLSRVENLIQDQGGALIKRYGTPILGASTDSAGNALTNPTKLLRMRSGLGLIGNSGKLYKYLENNSRFTPVDYVPDLNVSHADNVLSSAGVNVPSVYAVASSTKYHAVIHDIGTGVSNDAGYRCDIYERASGHVVHTIALDGSGAKRIVFVDDRYLHIFNNFSGIELKVVDTASIAFTTTTTAILAAGPTLTDVEVASGRSVLLYETTAPQSRVSTYDNTGTLITNVTLTGTGHLGLSVYGTSVWAWNGTVSEARTVASLGTVVTASGAGGPTVACAAYYSATVRTSFYSAIASTPSFGAVTVDSVTINSAIIHGWTVASKPFVDQATNVGYLHLTKSNGLTVCAHVIIRLPNWSVNSVTAETYSSFRIAASLEPMLGVKNIVSTLRYQRVGTGNDIEFCPMVPVQTVARGYSYSMFSCRPYYHAGCTVQNFGNQSYLSGGVHCVIGPSKLQECGFVDMPLLTAAVSGTAGPSGSFKHIAVYRYVDETGALTWSRTTPATTTVCTSDGIDLVITPPGVVMRDTLFTANPVPQLQSVEVYRTINAGTTYYLCGSSQVGTPVTGLATQAIPLAATGYYAFTDVLTDAVLATQPQLFRHPGVAGSAVDRYAPPCGNLLCQHKDRLFTSDPYGARVYYSSFFVDGETAWYNPAFSFFVHGGSGPITALVSMDGRLFVFKKDGVFVVDGDGPPEGGVSGNEFSPPHRLATEYGCIDARSVVVTTDGIVYRSSRGIEILTRSLQVKWIGDRVQNTVNANPKTTGAVLDIYGRVHIGLAVSDTGTPTQAATLGCEVIYDFPSDCWTVSYHKDAGGTANRCVQDIVQADLAGIGETVCYADPQGTVCYTSPTSGLDRGAGYIGWTVETVWIKMGQQVRGRFTKALMLAKKLTNHKLTISAAYNYVDSYTQVATWQPDTINAEAIEELELQFATQQTLAVRLLIQEAAPTDTGTYPVTTARGCDLLGITVEAMPKHGAPTVSAGRKA